MDKFGQTPFLYALVEMENQPSITASLTKDQQDKLSNNLVEALQILYRSVATRKIKTEIEKIKNENFMKDEGEKYGKYSRI